MMQLVNNTDLLTSIFEKYRRSECFFPLIGAVLEKKQEGSVYVDDYDHPGIVLVIHKFRFAQILYDEPSDATWKQICQLIDNSYPQLGKLRFYCAKESFITYLQKSKEYDYQTGERVRFIYTTNKDTDLADHIELLPDDIAQLNEQHHLEVESRFWSGEKDFLSNSLAFCLKEDGIIKSVCYAAAVSGQRAEIDVSTHQEYRKMGYAKQSTAGFIANCKKNGVLPVWDCYKNNIASMNTARSLGFEEQFSYEFLIITNNK